MGTPRLPKGNARWVDETRPIGMGKPTKGGCVYTPNNQMAEALVACLVLARETGELALNLRVPPEVRKALLALEERMDDRIFELTGHRYMVPIRPKRAA